MRAHFHKQRTAIAKKNSYFDSQANNLYCHKNTQTSEPCLTPEAMEIDWAGGQIKDEYIRNLHKISNILSYSKCGVLETQKLATKSLNERTFQEWPYIYVIEFIFKQSHR